MSGVLNFINGVLIAGGEPEPAAVYLPEFADPLRQPQSVSINSIDAAWRDSPSASPETVWPAAIARSDRPGANGRRPGAIASEASRLTLDDAFDHADHLLDDILTDILADVTEAWT